MAVLMAYLCRRQKSSKRPCTKQPSSYMDYLRTTNAGEEVTSILIMLAIHLRKGVGACRTRDKESFPRSSYTLIEVCYRMLLNASWIAVADNACALVMVLALFSHCHMLLLQQENCRRSLSR